MDDAFYDANFGGKDWEQELGEALSAAYTSDKPQRAYAEIGRMLSKLGDPFTRIVSPS